MKIEGAIERLQYIKKFEDECLFISDSMIGACDIAISALEKQIPKEPKPNKRIPGIGKCQICKTELYIDDEDLHYCPTCGQRLK